MTRLYETIYRAHQATSDGLKAEFARGQVNLTPQQLTVLEAIQERELPSQTNLVDATGIDRSTMADIVSRLVRKGYVTRKRTKTDARRYALTLTTAGKESVLRGAVIANRFEASIALNCPTAMKGLEHKLETITSATRDIDGSRLAVVAAE